MSELCLGRFVEWWERTDTQPNRVPGLRTASIAGAVVDGDDDDETLGDAFVDEPCSLPVRSVHEAVESLYFN